jgi:hypothetical protein
MGDRNYPAARDRLQPLLNLERFHDSEFNNLMDAQIQFRDSGQKSHRSQNLARVLAAVPSPIIRAWAMGARS